MAKKYLDSEGLLYLWQKIKTYFTGTAVPSMDGTAATGTSQKFAREDHVHPSDTNRAPISHAVTSERYGVGTNILYGHVKLSDTTTGTATAASGGTAATPKAVADALAAAKSYTDSAKAITDNLVIDSEGNLIVHVPGGSSSDYWYVASDNQLKGKVDKVSGKGLSTNDYTTAEKTKLGKLIFDSNDLIDASILPSYVDDVVEAYPRSGQTELSSTWLATGSASGTVITPESGKIYVLMADSTSYSTNTQFRWSGSSYVKLNDGGVSEITNAEIDTIMAS